MVSEPYFDAFWYKTGLKNNNIVDQNLEGARACCALPLDPPLAIDNPR